MAVVYRILKSSGYIYRTRIYDFTNLKCGRANEEDPDFPIQNYDDLDNIFDDARESEHIFVDMSKQIHYEDSPDNIYEDFIMPTNSRITALNLYENEDG